MNDLISRKVLYEEIARLEELARNRVLDTPSSNPCYARYSAQLNERTSLKHIIADMPTAYDVDKVVSELEKENERLKTLKNNCIALCDHEVVGIENKAYNYATEIVKRGGKDE